MPLRIAILTIEMGTGLSISAQVLRAALLEHGHTVEKYDLLVKPAQFTPPDCAIFLERFDPRFAGRFNVLIPNPEFTNANDVSLLERFELIACKTREAVRIIGPIRGRQCGYIGWTSLDRCQGDVPKDFDQCLHIAGCSAQKGTDFVLRAWAENRDLPRLTLLDWRTDRPLRPELPNLRVIKDRLSDAELAELMNRCGVHLCPSITEGFGHTMHEAMSCGAVLITTDAPPMNENTIAGAVFVPPVLNRQMGLATAYEVNPSGIAQAVRKVMAMSIGDRQKLAQAGRRQWEKNQADFVHAIGNMTKMIEQILTRPPGVLDIDAKKASGTKTVSQTFGASNRFRA